MSQGFAAYVDAWTKESEARMLRVVQTAIGDLATEMSKPRPEGRVPHQTGNLANSLLASTEAMPQVGSSGEEYKTPGVDAGALAAMIELGDTVYLGYRANYARRVNYGFVGEDSLGRTYNQSGAHFVESAAANWPAIVAAAIAKVRGS